MGYTSAATNIIGGEMQGWAALLAQQAMEDAFTGELKRQGEYRGQSTAMFNQQLPDYSVETANKEIAKGAGQREADYNTIEGRIPLGGAATQTDKRLLSTGNASRAKLGGYSDWGRVTKTSESRLNDVLKMVADRAHGSAQLLPYRLNAAQHSQDILAAVGQAISSIGGGSSNYSDLFGKGKDYSVTDTNVSDQLNSPNNGGFSEF